MAAGLLKAEISSCVPDITDWAKTQTNGAAHAAEIPHIFQVAKSSGFGLNHPQTPLNAQQQKLSDRLLDRVRQERRSPEQPFWPRFHRDQQLMLSLVPPTPTTEWDFARTHQCDFWDTWAGRTLPPNDHDRRAKID